MKAIREFITHPAMTSFSCVRSERRRFDCPYHYHPEIELTYIDAGCGQRLVGDHLAAFEPGDLVLIGPSLPHIYFHPPDFDNGPKGARSVVLFFEAGLAGGCLQHAPEGEAVRALLQRSERGLVFSPLVGAEVRRMLLALPKVKEPFTRLLTLLEILHRLAGDRGAVPLASEGFCFQGNHRQAERIERVCQWVNEHFQTPLTLADAAKKAHLSPSAFSRFFQRMTNRSFTRFVNELRIGHACRRLLESDRTIADVAFEVGFDTLSNFNRRFRQVRGMTPRDYRACFKEGIQGGGAV